MEKIMFFTRLLLLAVSFYGYIQFFRNYVRLELTISYVFCSIGSVLFLAGILNLLPEISWSIANLGVILAIISIHQKKSIKEVISWGTVFFLVGTIFFFFLLYNSKFTHYDNFSHWAVAPRLIIKNDRFPNFSDKSYAFQSYPLGSSVFIYYCAEITGLSEEWFQMFSQAFLLLGLVTSLFTFSSKFLSKLLISVCCIILLCSNTAFTDLLVDTLLPVTGLAGIAFCIYYKDTLPKKIYYTIPYSVFSISIKNSGIFFAILIVFLCLYYAHSDKSKKIHCAIATLSPFIFLFLWKKHVSLVFLSGLTSKHSMSIINFISVFQDKQPEDILSIITSICTRTFSLSNPAIHLLIISTVIWILGKYSMNLSPHSHTDILCLMLISYAVYQIGTVGMYLFSMPQYEALKLAGYARYQKTILIFIAGLTIINIVIYIETISSKYFQEIVISVLCIACLYFTLSPSFSYLIRQNLSGTEREKFDNLFEDYGILPNQRYAIIVSETRQDSGYLHYLSQYRLESQEYSIIKDSKLEEINWDNYDYILFFEETDLTRLFLSKNYPDVTEAVVYLNAYR